MKKTQKWEEAEWLDELSQLDSFVIACPTDTVYGLSCRWDDKEGIRRIGALKNRPNGPFIYLVCNLSQASQLAEFSAHDKSTVSRYWPGPTSIILPTNSGPEKTIALRMPNHPELLSLIERVGPILSTSCNPPGKDPAINVSQARAYFAEGVDLFIEGEAGTSRCSTLLDLTQSEEPIVLRQGGPIEPRPHPTT